MFRIFDDGIGFRYEIPRQASVDSVTITDEETQFRLHKNAAAWAQPRNHEYYEYVYEQIPVNRLDTVTTPLTMKVTDSLYMSIHEANLVD